MAFEMEPGVAQLAERLAAAYPKPPHLMTPAEIKATFGVIPPADPQNRPAGVTAKDDTIAARDPARQIAVRRFFPASAPRAKVAYYHGGGFTTGNLDSHDPVSAHLADTSGAEVIAVDYRKLPEHAFPAAYDDSVATAAALAMEGGPLGLVGDSSGANLALAAALALRGKTPIGALLLYYPVIGLDFDTPSYQRNAEAPVLTRARCQRIWDDYLSGKTDAVRAGKDWRAAPLLADDLRGLPPTVVVVAEYDPLLSEGVVLADRLKAAGVRTTLITAPRIPHGFVRWRSVSPTAVRIVEEATQAFVADLSRK